MSEGLKSRQTPGKRGEHGQFYKEVKFFVQIGKRRKPLSREGTGQRLEKWAHPVGRGAGIRNSTQYVGFLTMCSSPILSSESRIPEGAAAALLLDPSGGR